VGRQWSIVDPETGELSTIVENNGWHYRPAISTIEEANSVEARTRPKNGFMLDRLLPASPYGVVAVLTNGQTQRTMKLNTNSSDESGEPASAEAKPAP
jgi:hypothetical protein